MVAKHETAKLKVFISYSRVDAKFADELVAGLEFDGGFDITIDRHSIEKGEDWKARLGKLIEAADTIVFVLSPTSAASEICRWEVEHASALNKRILPVLHLPLNGAEPPPALDRINYIDFTVAPTLISGIRDLATALRTDLGWLREGTRLLNLALDWQRSGKRENRLLSGPDITEAKAWVAASPKSEQPTELHRDYIRASEAAEVSRLDGERAKLAELAEAQASAASAARRVAARTFAGLAVAVLLAGVAAWFGWDANRKAVEIAAQKTEVERQRGAAETSASLAKAEAARAEKSEKAAEATLREAQMTQSGLISETVKAILDRPGGGDAAVAMLLALESVVDERSDDPQQQGRPAVAEAQLQLDRAWRSNRETAFIAQRYGITSVAWSRDGKWLATGSVRDGSFFRHNGEAKIVEAATGKELVTVAYESIVWAVAWSPNGQLLSIQLQDGTVRIVQPATGTELARITGQHPIWSPDGKLIAVALADRKTKANALVLVEATTAKDVHRIPSDGEVNTVAWSPDGRLLATGLAIRSGDYLRTGEVKIIEVLSGKEITRVTNTSAVRSIAWSPDGRLLAVGSTSGEIRAIEAITWQDVDVAFQHLGGELYSVSWSPDGRLLAAATFSKTVWIFESTTGKEVARLASEDDSLATAWSPDSRWLAIGSKDGKARIVDAATGREFARINHDHWVDAVAWSPDSRLLATGSRDSSVRIVDLDDSSELLKIDGGGSWGDSWSNGEWSPDGLLLAMRTTGISSAQPAVIVRVVEAATRKELWRSAHEPWVGAVAWSPDGRRIATTSNSAVRIFDAATGKELALVHDEYEARVNSVAWSPDGRWLATGSGERSKDSVQDGSVRVVDTATGNVIVRIARNNTVWAVAWSPDGRLLATGSDSATARIYDIATGKEFTRITGRKEGAARAVAWSPDGQRLAIGMIKDETYEALIVEAATGKELTRIPLHFAVSALAWSPDSKRLALGATSAFNGDFGELRIVEVETSKDVFRTEEIGAVTAVAWNADGTTLRFSAGAGGITERNSSFRIWRVFPAAQALVDAAKARAARCLTQKQRAQYFLPAAPQTWCVERRLWPYQSDDWQAWLPKQRAYLTSGRQGEAPVLPKAE